MCIVSVTSYRNHPMCVCVCVYCMHYYLISESIILANLEELSTNGRDMKGQNYQDFSIEDSVLLPMPDDLDIC